MRLVRLYDDERGHAHFEDLIPLITSAELLAEIKEVLSRPRFSRRYKIAAVDIEELTTLLRGRAETVAITGTVRLCRDPDDDLVIEAARVGRAGAVVTRDDDLKSDWDLMEVLLTEGIQVLSVTRFLAAVGLPP